MDYCTKHSVSRGMFSSACWRFNCTDSINGLHSFIFFFVRSILCPTCPLSQPRLSDFVFNTVYLWTFVFSLSRWTRRISASFSKMWIHIIWWQLWCFDFWPYIWTVFFCSIYMSKKCINLDSVTTEWIHSSFRAAVFFHLPLFRPVSSLCITSFVYWNVKLLCLHYLYSFDPHL